MKNLVKILVAGNVCLLVWTTFRDSEVSENYEDFEIEETTETPRNQTAKTGARLAKTERAVLTNPSIKKDIEIWEEQSLRRKRMDLACQKYDEIQQLIKNAGFRELLAFHEKIYNLEEDKLNPRFGKPRPWIRYGQTSAIVYIEKEKLG